MRITRVAVSFPTLTIIATIIVVIWGCSYFLTMSRREDPEIKIKTAMVITYFPGALPEDIEQYVSKPIEDVAAEIESVSEISSISRYSISVVFVSLDANTPTRKIDQTWDRLRNKIDRIRDSLPAGTSDPYVDDEFFDTNSHVICLSGENYSQRELVAFADRIKRRLSQLPDAGRVEVFGEIPERIYLEFDIAQVIRYGIQPDLLIAAIQGQNTLFPGGQLEAGGLQFSIDSSGGFASLDDLNDLPIFGTPGAQQVRLGDLGDIRYAYEDPPIQVCRVNGLPCVCVTVVMKTGKNVIKLGEQVEGELTEIQTSLPSDLILTTIQDQPREVKLRIDTFLSNLLSGIGLVILVVLLFMGLRASVPVGLALPLVIISCFAVFSIFNTDLQQMSIAGLIISLGMLVDNAIVVTDNISRYVKLGLPAEEAAVKGTTELATPMLTSSLTTVCAFVPLAMMTGESGDFVRDIPVVVSISIMLSYVFAITVTPMICAYMFRESRQQRSFAPLASVMAFCERMYPPMLRWTQRHVLLTGLIVSCAFIASGFLFTRLGVQFFPGAERDQFAIDIFTPQGTSLQETERVTRDVEEILSELDGIISYAAFIGKGGPSYYYSRVPETQSPRYAEFLINTINAEASSELVPIIRQACAERVAGARIEVNLLEQGPPVGAPLQIKVRGDQIEQLKRIGTEVAEVLKQTPNVIDVRDSFGENSRQLRIDVDETQARAIGLTRYDINKLTAMLFGGALVTEYRAPERTIPVVLRMKPEYRSKAGDLERLYVTNQYTKTGVPLSSIAKFETREVTSTIQRFNRERELVVSAGISQGLASDALAVAQQQIDQLALPPGYRIIYSGEAEESGEAFANLAAASVVAVLLIVMILVVQFKSIRISMVVFMAVPLAMIGAVLGLWITGWPFGFTAGLGIISLAGIVINNSIVLMDFIMMELRAGKDLESAIAEAGQARQRPILLTTATTIGGLLPLGLFGGSMWAPMSFAIIGGLIVSTFLTLFIVPLLFRLIASRRALVLAQETQQEMVD